MLNELIEYQEYTADLDSSDFPQRLNYKNSISDKLSGLWRVYTILARYFIYTWHDSEKIKELFPDEDEQKLIVGDDTDNIPIKIKVENTKMLLSIWSGSDPENKNIFEYEELKQQYHIKIENEFCRNQVMELIQSVANEKIAGEWGKNKNRENNYELIKKREEKYKLLKEAMPNIDNWLPRYIIMFIIKDNKELSDTKKRNIMNALRISRRYRNYFLFEYGAKRYDAKNNNRNTFNSISFERASANAFALGKLEEKYLVYISEGGNARASLKNKFLSLKKLKAGKKDVNTFSLESVFRMMKKKRNGEFAGSVTNIIKELDFILKFTAVYLLTYGNREDMFKPMKMVDLWCWKGTSGDNSKLYDDLNESVYKYCFISDDGSRFRNIEPLFTRYDFSNSNIDAEILSKDDDEVDNEDQDGIVISNDSDDEESKKECSDNQNVEVVVPEESKKTIADIVEGGERTVEDKENLSENSVNVTEQKAGVKDEHIGKEGSNISFIKMNSNWLSYIDLDNNGNKLTTKPAHWEICNARQIQKLLDDGISLVYFKDQGCGGPLMCFFDADGLIDPINAFDEETFKTFEIFSKQSLLQILYDPSQKDRNRIKRKI